MYPGYIPDDFEEIKKEDFIEHVLGCLECDFTNLLNNDLDQERIDRVKENIEYVEMVLERFQEQLDEQEDQEALDALEE